MSKVIGAIFTLLGTLIGLFLIFLYLNSPAYLDFNTDKMRLNETGLILPILGDLFLLITGICFLVFSDDR